MTCKLSCDYFCNLSNLRSCSTFGLLILINFDLILGGFFDIDMRWRPLRIITNFHRYMMSVRHLTYLIQFSEGGGGGEMSLPPTPHPSGPRRKQRPGFLLLNYDNNRTKDQIVPILRNFDFLVMVIFGWRKRLPYFKTNCYFEIPLSRDTNHQIKYRKTKLHMAVILRVLHFAFNQASFINRHGHYRCTVHPKNRG